MENSAIAGETLSWAAGASQELSLRRVRLTVVALWGAFVVSGVAVSSLRFVNSGHQYSSAWGFITQQKDVLGLLAVVSAILTLCCGLVSVPALAARLRVSVSRARAIQGTLAPLTVVTIGLHLGAVAASSEFGASFARLVVPFVWNDRSPDPVAAGVLASWLIALCALALAAVGRMRDLRGRGLLHGVLAVALALALLHGVLLAGWIHGWAM